MIRVRKPVRPPAILSGRGARATEADCLAYEASPPEYDGGTMTFGFDATIYGAKSVKNALIKAQHAKCVFCESKITHIAHGDVEHFRPKAGYSQNAGDPLGRPGYYWLAYAWANLYFCCQICNQRFKRNLFPLEDPAARARTHQDDLVRERPLFLDPATDDPAAHIGFRDEIAFPVDGSPRGAATVRELALNRPELVERRRDFLAKLALLKDQRSLIARMLAEHGDDAELRSQLLRIQRILQLATEPRAEYSGMARALLAS